MKTRSYLGIIDWGIGGIGIYKLLEERLGPLPVIYFSDTGAAPYGKMTRSELTARLNKVIGYLRDRGASHIVIGCNAASTALPFLNCDGIKVAGVIDSAVRLARRENPARLGLVGGRRTVLSGVYRRAFRKAGIVVEQRIAQPLSGLIESGDVSSEKLKAEARRILGPIRNSSHILLACTHYPAITPLLREFVSEGTVFIDPADELVADIGRWDLPRRSDSIFLTTGDAAKMKKAASNAFGVTLREVEKITL